MFQDLRYAARSLGRARGFTVAAVLTLTLGMAANTIVYGVVNGMLLRPLPFGERSDRLITLHSTHPTQAQDWDNSEISYPDLIDVRERVSAFEAVEGFLERNLSLAAEAGAERVAGASITPGLFGLLGVRPPIGRDFTGADAAEPGFETVAIISHRLWERLFESDPAITGRTLMVNGRGLTVIGVMPPRFAFPENQDVWLPYRSSRDEGRAFRSVMGVALLDPGATLRTARAELAAVAASLADEYPETNRQWGLHALAFRDLYITDVTRRGLTAMLVAVGLVLLVACANVASLLVARGIGRRQELTIRAALGASRARIIRLLLVESLVLSVIGALLALLVATWGLDALLATIPEPPAYWARPEIDARVLAFVAVATIVTALASGLLPALRAGGIRLAPGILHSARSSGGGTDQRRLQGLLVAGQVALSFALLVAATLLARSAAMLQHADIGFDSSPLLSLRVYVAGDAYNDPVARARIVQQLVSRLREIPGAESASATGAIPGDDGGATVRVMPPRPSGTAGEELGVQMIPITSDFFETLGLQVSDGRTFDSAESARVDGNAVIVSRRLGDLFWPGESPVGRELRARSNSDLLTLRIVGVAPDVVYEEVGEQSAQSRLIVYVPYVRGGWRTMALLVRTRTAPASIAAAARAAVRDVDSTFAAFDLMTMRERRRATSWGERFLGRTFSTFAIVAVLLACVGACGLTAHAAAQRVREIGLRLAIGAQRADIVRLLLGRGARLAVLGGLAGLPLAAAAARLVEGLLFQTSPWNPAIWFVLPAALLAAVLLASFLPAHRASLIDPAIALRQD